MSAMAILLSASIGFLAALLYVRIRKERIANGWHELRQFAKACKQIKANSERNFR